MRKYLTSLAGTAALILATLTGTAGAEDVLKLRLADSFPSGHFIGRFAVLPFIERVKELSNNTVQFEYYPAQQLGKAKDLLALTQSGVVDIGYVGPSYVSDKMPLSDVATCCAVALRRSFTSLGENSGCFRSTPRTQSPSPLRRVTR